MVGAISDVIPKGGQAVMIEVSAQGGDSKGCTLGLGKVVFVVVCKVFIHGGYVVNTGPLSVGVFGVPVV